MPASCGLHGDRVRISGEALRRLNRGRAPADRFGPEGTVEGKREPYTYEVRNAGNGRLARLTGWEFEVLERRPCDWG